MAVWLICTSALETPLEVQQVHANSPASQPQYDGLIGVCGLVFLSWALVRVADGVSDIVAVALRKEATRSRRWSSVLGYVHYDCDHPYALENVYSVGADQLRDLPLLAFQLNRECGNLPHAHHESHMPSPFAVVSTLFAGVLARGLATCVRVVPVSARTPRGAVYDRFPPLSVVKRWTESQRVRALALVGGNALEASPTWISMCRRHGCIDGRVFAFIQLRLFTTLFT